jgi:hypothetical protein
VVSFRGEGWVAGGGGSSVAAGAVAELGDVFGWGVAVWPGGVALVVGDVFAGAADGVGVDAVGEGIEIHGGE